ncbi:hypothetical protein BOX15_Mlig026982g3, partial [Macrostomum lignano]
IFAYVVEPPPVTMGAGFASAVSADLYANSVNEAIQAGKRLASQTKEKCETLGLQNHTRFLERMTSGAGPAIVEIANEEDVSLIVMGNRGMGTLRRTFLGSVSDYVLHHAHRPTIIVPPAKPAGAS